MEASRGEITIKEILLDSGLNFKEEFSFPELKSPGGTLLRFDFAVFDDDWNLLFLIEYQGRQHYEASSKFGGSKGLYRQRFNDNLKRRQCGLHNIILVEIPYTDEWQLSYDYIMNKAGIL